MQRRHKEISGLTQARALLSQSLENSAKNELCQHGNPSWADLPGGIKARSCCCNVIAKVNSIHSLCPEWWMSLLPC